MPDITLCKDEYCKIKHTCHRYKAKPCMYQSYFTHSPRREKDLVKSKDVYCLFFIQVEK